MLLKKIKQVTNKKSTNVNTQLHSAMISIIWLMSVWSLPHITAESFNLLMVGFILSNNGYRSFK